MSVVIARAKSPKRGVLRLITEKSKSAQINSWWKNRNPQFYLEIVRNSRVDRRQCLSLMGLPSLIQWKKKEMLKNFADIFSRKDSEKEWPVLRLSDLSTHAITSEPLMVETGQQMHLFSGLPKIIPRLYFFAACYRGTNLGAKRVARMYIMKSA